jgi:hypothetical protein
MLTDLPQAGDEEHNPFSQWETLERDKEAELQAKAVKRQTARQAQYVRPRHFTPWFNTSKILIP